jgi:hypothetical protein
MERGSDNFILNIALVALCMAAHGQLYTCCTVHVSTRTAVHLLHCAWQHTDSCTLYTNVQIMHVNLSVFRPHITWLQRLNLGRNFMKFNTNLLKKLLFRKGESRPKKSAHRQSIVT